MLAERVSVRTPPPARVIFNEIKGEMNVTIQNASKRYTTEELKGFGEMIAVLQSEGKAGKNGTMLLVNLEKM